MSALPISELYGKSGAGKVLGAWIVSASRTVVLPQAGLLDVMVIGGHGGGGAVGGAGFVSGASTGECAFAYGIPVAVGDSAVATIGAGGAQVTASGATRVSGNNGGDSQLVVGGRTIIAKAGRGAVASATKPATGPRGGFGGTGGDLHVEGGPGGSVIATTAAAAVAGGGAVGILQNPPAERAGGDINATGPAERSAGAGVGGKGGSVTGSGGAGATPTGGGSGGPGVDSTANSVSIVGPNFIGQLQQASPVPLLQYAVSQWGLDVFGGGGTGAISAGPGGGSASNGSTVVATGYMGGVAGHGQLAVASSSGLPANGGAGGSAVASGSGTCVGTAGAAGLIVLVLREA
jgi:hypothetical protein